MQRVEGQVQQVRCSSCTAAFPTFIFAGDTDMATSGLEAATSVQPAFVVLGKLDSDELGAEYAAGRARFASRMSRLLGAELVALTIVRWVHGPSGEGMTFQQFQQVHRPSEPIYACPNCGSDAAVVERLRPADFIEQGGRLELVGELTLT